MSDRSFNFALRRFIVATKHFLNDRFNLHEDKASNRETIEYIEKGVLFRGPNLWILMFAILIASIGLNVNSAAVVIGAMLISPLMGPIMGIGLGVGINDFELIVKALKNLGIAVGISILTSTVYFMISPLQEAQSELLARTTPTLWDVLIGLFGGLAGIVAGSRKEKSNAIPGVAIATALMPPLCTAGYGLATAQWHYFVGAFYLFFINSVFISFSTFLIVRALKFPRKEFMDADREVRVKRYIGAFVLLTMVPSVFTAYYVVRQSVFERKANTFINQEFVMENVRVIGREYSFDRTGSTIEVTLLGTPLTPDEIDGIRQRMRLPNYRLDNCQLVVHQGYFEDDDVDLATVQQMNQNLRIGIIEDLYKKNEQLLLDRDKRIRMLEDEIVALRSRDLPISDLATEIKAINTNVREFTISPTLMSSIAPDSLKVDTLFLAYASFEKDPRPDEVTTLEEWLKARIKTTTLRLIAE